MSYEQLFDLQKIEEYLRKDVYLHIYGIGDLDEFFRPYTTWYGPFCSPSKPPTCGDRSTPSLPTHRPREPSPGPSARPWVGPA